MSIDDSDLIGRLHAVAEAFEMPPSTPTEDVWRGRRRVRRNRGLLAGAAVAAVAAVIAASAAVSVQHRAGRHPIEQPDPTPTTITEGPAPAATPVRGDLVLRLDSWESTHRAAVELAVYSDGWAIWHHDEDPPAYHQVRLSPEGVSWLEGTVRATGLFGRDHALGVDGSSGDLQVRVGDRTAIVAWGRSEERVASTVEGVLEGTGRSLRAPFVGATQTQSVALLELEELLRDPGSWTPPPGAFEQREDLPFVPTHLSVTWDRGVPDPAQLPPPARQVLGRYLEPVVDHGCAVISLAEARQMVQAMEQAGLAVPDDVTDGIAFSMPARDADVSYVHGGPLLPGDPHC